MNCRHCHTPLKTPFLDLGKSPPSNNYILEENLSKPEVILPLRVHVCNNCWLVQTEDYAASDSLFTESYAYFSSTSRSWLAHAKDYCDMMTARLRLNNDSFVVELASNDGYLLKNFVSSNIPCMGIEPTDSTAHAAEEIGVPTLREFFGNELAIQLAENDQKADLILGNNVYAHVPDINDFTKGIATLLKPNGTVTLEFPHLMELMKFTQFDTVYHEHYSYLSLGVVTRIFKQAGLRVYDVETLKTHGGSLRVYGCHINDMRDGAPSVANMLALEKDFGLETLTTYSDFQKRCERIKEDLLTFLKQLQFDDKRIAAYGAAAKGNTLLNFAGVKADLLPFVCDAAKAKQNKYLPGSHIPIYPPEALRDYNPDYVFILPWNLAEEIVEHFYDLKDQGTQFVIAVPEVRLL